ncbi:MAG: two-component system response regulator [Nitrospirae bacterium]|nr:two-component system response regulator [Nitrospirota bacterium]
MPAAKQSILIVEDTPENIDILNELLGSEYQIRVALKGETALKIVNKSPVDLILLDIMMPGMDGYEVCKRLKEDNNTCSIPVIFLTALFEEQNEAKGLALGAVDYITKPFTPELVKARVKNHLELKRHQDNLESMVQERTQELAVMQEITIESLGTLAEYRDPETGGHIIRTKYFVKILSDHISKHPKFSSYLNEEVIDLLFKCAPLHDIGKVAVPDAILKKAGKLTVDEYEEMKKHTIYGYEALRAFETKLANNVFLNVARELAYTHHEKYDGSGYPQGLKGDNIPISGRLMAIADVYDALISKRVYKPPFSHKKSTQIILEGKGTHFDPVLVDAFLELEDTFRKIAFKYADFDEERESLSLI